MAPRSGQQDNRLELKKIQKRKEQVKIAMRRHRQNLTEEQLEEGRKKDRERYQWKLSIECRPDQISSHYEIGVINTEYNQISTDQIHVLVTPLPSHQSDSVISEEPGPLGLFSHIGNESPARCVDTDDEGLVTVSILTIRSRNFYFKSVYGSSSEENSDEEIKKKQVIDKVFSEAADFYTIKKFRLNIITSASSDDDIF